MASKDYQIQLNRLKEEQQRAIQETDDNIRQWEKFKSDYDALRKRLKTLPDKLSHDVMVPFGKMGFMPGRLVHTNEILVLLGDNWFVDRSAKQAAEIVTRRIKVVDKQLEELHKQRKLLEPRRDFTEDLQAMAEGGGEMFDVREDYDEEKEKLWREKHKQNVVEHKRKQRKARDKAPQHTARNQQQSQQLTDAQLWERLDELEQIELQEREMEKVTDMDSNAPRSDVRELNARSGKPEQVQPETVKAHSFKDSKLNYTLSEEESDTSSSRSLDSDDEEVENEGDEEEEYDEEEITEKGKVIHFTHSIGQGPAGDTNSSSAGAEPSSIASPADIYARFKPPDGPVSILKKTKKSPTTASRAVRERRERKRVVGFDTGSDEEGEAHSPVKETVSRQDLEKAFSGTVKEKMLSNLPTLYSTNQDDPHKPVFKMRSANQNQTSIPMQVSKHSAEMDNVRNDNQSSDNVKPVSKFKAQREKLNPP